MKKIKLNDKLSLNKKMVSRLGDNQMADVKGGREYDGPGPDIQEKPFTKQQWCYDWTVADRCLEGATAY